MELILLLVLLGLSAAFSGSETAFFSLGRAELAQMERTDGPSGRQVNCLVHRATELLSGLLIGNLLVNTAASVVASSLAMKAWGTQGLMVAVPAVTLALLLLGEITPKMLALRFRQPVARVSQGPLRFWLWMNGPVIRIIGWVVALLLRWLPFERTGTRPLTTEELQMACDVAVAEGTLTETEGRSLGRLLTLGDREVRQVMTPRPEVVTLQRDESLPQILDTAQRAGFNRYPVLEPDAALPVGFFHLKDLLQVADRDNPLGQDLRPLLYVPESKDVGALLTLMRRDTVHLAGVVDEHGDFVGIVTMADCLQALLGPVMDSTGGGDQAPIPLGDGRWVLGGRTDLEELRETTGLVLPPSRDYLTVAGFLMAELGRVLQPGDRVTLPGARITVLEMSGMKVDTLQVTLLREGRPAGDGNGGAA